MTSSAPPLKRPVPPERNRFIAVAVLVPFALVVFALWLGSEYRRADAVRNETRASYSRRVEALQLLSDLRAAETSQRGFVLTGNPAFLGDYPATERGLLARVDRLPAVYADDPPQRARARALVASVRAKFAEMDQVIALRRGQGLGAAVQRVSEGRGKRLMDIAAAQAQSLAQAEEHARATAIDALQARNGSVERVVWAGVAMISAALIIGLILLSRSRQARYESDLAAHVAAQRHRIILDSTRDAILILNPSGTIETVNAAATRMLGYAPDELARRDIGVVLDLPGGQASFHQRIGFADGELREPVLPDRQARHKNGHSVPVDIGLGLMELPAGLFVVASLRDISQRKQVERIKDDLVSTVSHELRTPLTSVVGALGLLRASAKGLSADATRLVEIADNNARRLIRLINDMLDIDRIEAGKFEIKRMPLDLAEIARRAATDGEGLAASAGVRLASAVPAEPVRIAGDGERLLQVIGNLVSNAVRVSPAGGVVTIGVERRGGLALLFVDDQGPGVPAEFRERIFGRFERVQRDDGAVGTGLGLAISREIIHRHDGRIWFEDRPEGGTRFAFELPAIGSARWGAFEPGARVLLVEDDDDVAEALVDLVEVEGYAANRVASAAAARAAVIDERYAALILDLKLPDGNGLTLAHELRDAQGDHAPPIIIVTGSGPGGEPALMPLDVIDWIEKPASPDRLAVALRVAVARSDARMPVILHLDDDQDTLDVTASALSGEARMLQARDLETARRLLRRNRPDAAILDLNLEHGSGLDLLPELVDTEGAPIPSILYSAHDVAREASRAVDAVLIKSRGSLPDLRAVLRRVLVKGRRDAA